MNKKVRSYRKIDEHSFNAIKKLIETGLTGREIQRAMNISASTFWRVKSSETLTDYKDYVAVKNYKYKYNHPEEKTEGQEVAETISETAFTPLEINFTEAQAEIVIEVLNKILEKVSTIADNTKPKGLFR